MSNINYQPLYDLIKSVSIDQLPEIIEHAVSAAGKRIDEELWKAREHHAKAEAEIAAIEAIREKVSSAINEPKFITRYLNPLTDDEMNDLEKMRIDIKKACEVIDKLQNQTKPHEFYPNRL